LALTFITTDGQATSKAGYHAPVIVIAAWLFIVDDSKLGSGGPTYDPARWPHRYGAVHNSTGLAGAEAELPQLTGDYADLLELPPPTIKVGGG